MLDPVTASIIVGASGAGNLLTGGLNYYQQSKNLEYQKWAQKKQWAREDTAVQRRAKDLEAAGMSKTLGAGNAAQAGPVVQTHAPQLDRSAFDPGMLIKSFVDITQTMAQADLTRENARIAGINADLLKEKQQLGQAQKEMDLLQQQTETAKASERAMKAQAGLSGQKAMTEIWNRYWAIQAKLPTNASGWSQFQGALSNQIIEKHGQLVREMQEGNKQYEKTMAEYQYLVEEAVKKGIETGKTKPLPWLNLKR